MRAGGGAVGSRAVADGWFPAVGFRERNAAGFTVDAPRAAVLGAVPDFTEAPSDDLRKIARLPGLYAELGLGSRGSVWSSLMAELLARQITGEPLPLERVLPEATDPARFWVRARRENAGRSAGASKDEPGTAPAAIGGAAAANGPVLSGAW